MKPQISAATVIMAIRTLHTRHDKWPTAAEIADWLEVDQAVVNPLLSTLRAKRLFDARQRQGRKVWMPWEDRR